MSNRKDEDIGFGKPPQKTRFKPGKSGNPKGRPKGARNLSSILEAELNGRIPVKENGRERRLSRSAVMIKQLVGKATAGDPKATQAVLAEARTRELGKNSVARTDVFDTPEYRLVMADIVRRIRSIETPIKTDSQGRTQIKKGTKL